jgi:hypothetical protein
LCSRITCSNAFTLDDPDAKPPYFCSDDCQLLAVTSGRRSRQCKWCQKELVGSLAHSRNDFCSLECITHASEDITCARCDQPVAVSPSPPWFRVQKYCSKACREEQFASRLEGAYQRNGYGQEEGNLEALDYMQLLHQASSDEQVHTLPTRPSGKPFLHLLPEDLPEELPKRFSTALKAAIKFRNYQVIKAHESHGHEPYWKDLLMLLGNAQATGYIGVTSGIPIQPTNSLYLPTLAQVYPWLSHEARKICVTSTWAKRNLRYTGNSPTRRAQAIFRLEEHVHTERLRLATDDYPKTSDGLSNFTVQARELFVACQHLHRMYSAPPAELYILPKHLPLLDVMNAEVEYWMQTWINNTWDNRKPKVPGPLVPGTGRKLWNHMLNKASVDLTTFAHWFWLMNTESNGMGKPWTYTDQEFNPDDC